MEKQENKTEKLNKARQFCLDVEILAKQYDLSFFLVTEGASMSRNKDCPAVENARQKHIEWEKSHSIDSNEDWLLKIK